MNANLCCEMKFHSKRHYFDFRVLCYCLLTRLLYLIWKLRAKGNNPVMLIICSNPQWCLQKRRPPIIHRCPPHSVWVKQCPPWCLITRPCYFCSCTFKIQLFSFCSFFFSRALFSGLCWCITASRYSSALLSTRVGSSIPDSAPGQRDWSTARQWHQWSLKLRPLQHSLHHSALCFCLCVCGCAG